MSIIEKIDDKYEVYRIVTDMEALHEAFRERIEDLETTHIEIDAAGKLQPGYTSKLLAPKPMKQFGKESLPRMLKATGMALVLVIDDERFAPIKAMLAKRERPLRANARIVKPAWLFTRDQARLMGGKRWAGLSEKKRASIARKAAKARWAKRRKERERTTQPENV